MLSFTLRGMEYQAATLAGISAAYSKIRDESGEGATTFPFVMAAVAGEEFGYISYNGRVWAGAHGRDSKPHNSPLYDPCADPVPDVLAALRELQTMLDDWPTMRALSATGSAKATENKTKARDLIAAAIAKAEASRT